MLILCRDTLIFFLLSVGYVYYILILEFDKFIDNNRFGMYFFLISVLIVKFGWLLFFFWDSKLGFFIFYRVRLYSFVDKIFIVKKNFSLIRVY